MQKVVLATSNPGKVKEFQELLASIQFDILPQSHFNVPDAAETGFSFVENAILKARNAAAHTGLSAIADDSGIEVDALDGAPGIYSARYAGLTANSQENNHKLLAALNSVPAKKRTARFQCVLVFMTHAKDPTPLICQGTWQGSILLKPQGSQGFGYDPLFYVPTHNCSAAELPAAEKNRISHRGQAMQKLLSLLQEKIS